MNILIFQRARRARRGRGDGENRSRKTVSFTCDANIYLSVCIMGVKDIMFFLNIFEYLLLFNFVHGKFAQLDISQV